MYQVIKDYFDLRIAEFNAMNSDYLVETSITLNRDRLPLNQRQANYSIKLDNFNSSESQSESYLVSGEVELTFSMVNKKIIDYEAVQEYIYKLARYIRRKENYTSANKHFGIISIGGEDLNNLNEGSTELSTKLVFEGEYYETNAVTLTVPSAPTLTSPVNGSTTATVDQAFQWANVTGAISYTYELSNTGGVVFTQTGLTVSSFTIPIDSALTNGSSYSWRVRAVGEAGNGTWSSYYTFTVNDDPSAGVPTLIEPLASTETSLTVTFLWTLSNNSTSYDIQVASDSGFTSLLVDTNVSKTSYEYTFSADGTYYWRVRGENSLGNSAWASSSVIVDAPLPDYRTGLVAEWIADTGVTSDENGVSAWVDTISSRSATQSTTSNKPYYAAGAKNGKAAIRFFGASNHQWLTFSSLALTNYTIIVVYKATSFRAGDSNYFFGGSSQGLFSSINALSIGYGEFDGTRIRAVTYNGSDTSWNVRSFQNTKLYSNGTEATYSNTQNMTGLTLTTIGTRGDNTSLSFKGEIACIRVYDSVLSTTNRAIAEAYLNGQYAIY